MNNRTCHGSRTCFVHHNSEQQNKQKKKPEKNKTKNRYKQKCSVDRKELLKSRKIYEKKLTVNTRDLSSTVSFICNWKRNLAAPLCGHLWSLQIRKYKPWTQNKKQYIGYANTNKRRPNFSTYIPYI